MTYNPNQYMNYERGRGSIYSAPPKAKSSNANEEAAKSMGSVGIGGLGGKTTTSSAQKIQDMFKESRERRRDKAKSSTPVGLGTPTVTEPEEDDRNLDQKIYDMIKSFGGNLDSDPEPVYPMEVYESYMFRIPDPVEVTQQTLADPFDAYNVDTYNFGGYNDTKDTAPYMSQTEDPDMQDPRRGLMRPPTMTQPATPDELTNVPRALAVSAAIPTETYLIKEGDTLSEIARDKNTTVEAIMKANSQIVDKDEIDAGATIEIPKEDDGLTPTQRALRAGLGSKTDYGEGVEVAENKSLFQQALDYLGFGGVDTIEEGLSNDDLGIPDTDNYMGYLPNTPSQQLLDKIAEGEGAIPSELKRQEKYGIGTTEYDMVYAYGRYAAPDKPLTQMTLQEVFDFQNKLINATKNGKVPGTDEGTSAVGKYQLIKKNLFGPNGTPEKPQKDRWADKLKLTPDMIFTPALQEKIGRLALKETGYDNYMKGKKTQKATLNRIADIWASVEGNNYKQGTATKQADLIPFLDMVKPESSPISLEIDESIRPKLRPLGVSTSLRPPLRPER